ncbi:MAG: thiamine pyrophosphate-dependent enzyme [Candidatus Firestonebacteria bacterium]
MKITKDEAIKLLKQMLQIRYFEEKVMELLSKNLVQGASHLYAGEEAVAVGACSMIKENDIITSTHRGHGHCIAKGGKVNLMLAELCGRATGYCRGRGGSMHIADVTKGNLGANGIVGGSIAMATGAALSCKMRGTDQVVLCFFGDGASNQGLFHESLNMAAVWKLPVIYICENNLYGMSVAVHRCFPTKDVAIRAKAYDIPGEIVDGMNIFAVKEIVGYAVERARKKEGPSLIECKTYRYYGHSRSDPRKYRTKEEEQEWREKCPIMQFKKKAQELNLLTQNEMDNIEKDVIAEITDAEKFTLESPYPDVSELYDDLYV